MMVNLKIKNQENHANTLKTHKKQQETIKSMKNQENVVKSWKPTKNREKPNHQKTASTIVKSK